MRDNNKNIVTAKPLGVNAGVAQAYASRLRTMTRAFISAFTEKLIEFYAKHKKDMLIWKKSRKRQLATDADIIGANGNIAYDSDIIGALSEFLRTQQYYFSMYFSKHGEKESKKMLQEAIKNTQATFRDNIKSVLKDDMEINVSPIPKGMDDVFEKSVARNVAYISSIPTQFFGKITAAVMSCFTQGKPISQLKKDIQKLGNVYPRQAELIGLDQTRKAYANINILRMKDAGVKKFKWLHTGGGLHPRAYHRDVLNGQIFDIDNPPIIDPKTQQRGLPGELINCKCVMIPVIL